MLSQENKSKPTEAETAIAQREANRAARGLATALVSFERNTDPHTERNAPNPADGVHIRALRQYGPRPTVAKSVQDHNSVVSGIGHPDLFKSKWGER